MRDMVNDAVADEPSFRDVAEALSLGVPVRLHLSADGRVRFLHVGANCLSVLGVPAEAVLADPQVLPQLIVPEDLELMAADKASYLAGRACASIEVRARRPSGELRWLRFTSAARGAPNGGRLLDGLIIDVTESKRLSEQLAEERQRLEQAIELTGIGVFQWDRDDPETVLWSDHQYAIYGIPPHTPMTRACFRQMIHPDDVESTSQTIEAALQNESGGDLCVEHRIVRGDGEVRWVQLHLRFRRDDKGLQSLHGTTLDVTERRNAEERGRLQVRELTHRGKNVMTVMMAVVQQAARASDCVEQLVELVMARLAAMAKSQDLATASEGAPLPLTQVAGQVLEPFDLLRIDLDPALEAVTVTGDAAISLALLLHELATNALKYGALSNAHGRVALSRRARKDGWIEVEWRESGGPAVKAPAREGFGMRLLKTALQNRGGGVTLVFAPDGFVATLEMPAG